MSKTYMTLIQEFPLRPIKTDREAKEALERFNDLKVHRDEKDYQDYLEVLATLLSQWEDVKYPRIAQISVRGPELLADLIEEHEIKKSELAAAMNIAPSNLSGYLNGSRSLPRDAISYLANRFRLPFEAFDFSPVSNSLGVRVKKTLIQVRDKFGHLENPRVTPVMARATAYKAAKKITKTDSGVKQVNGKPRGNKSVYRRAK